MQYSQHVVISTNAAAFITILQEIRRLEYLPQVRSQLEIQDTWNKQRKRDQATMLHCAVHTMRELQRSAYEIQSKCIRTSAQMQTMLFSNLAAESSSAASSEGQFYS